MLLRGPQFRSGSALGPVSRPPRIAAPGRFFGSPWWPPPAPCSVALNCGLAAWAGIPAPPNSGPRPLFWGALVAPAGGLLRGPQLRSGSEGRYPGPPPEQRPQAAFSGRLGGPRSSLLRGPQLRSGSEGRYPGPPRIAAPGRFFGAPWWPPPEDCSGALNCGLAARAGIPAPRIAAPGRFFGAPARGLLRGPQFRIAWLSVATGTTVVRRNKYRFRIMHIYTVKPITWQPSTTQTDGGRQWAERVLCLIGGPRETVYSDCSDEHFKKTEGQIGQTQAFSPKRPRARTRRAFHGRDAGLHREGNSRRRLCAHRYSIC